MTEERAKKYRLNNEEAEKSSLGRLWCGPVRHAPYPGGPSYRSRHHSRIPGGPGFTDPAGPNFLHPDGPEFHRPGWAGIHQSGWAKFPLLTSGSRLGRLPDPGWAASRSGSRVGRVRLQAPHGPSRGTWTSAIGPGTAASTGSFLAGIAATRGQLLEPRRESLP